MPKHSAGEPEGYEPDEREDEEVAYWYRALEESCARDKSREVARESIEALLPTSRDAFVPWNDLHGEGATERFRFVKLALDWTRATGALSSRQEKFAHPAYAAIQKLGRAIVPDVLRWIALGGAGHWDELLFELTGACPEPPGDERDLEAIHHAWVAWGRSQKLLPEEP